MFVGDLELDEEDLGGYKLNEDVEITIGEGDTKLSVLLDKVFSQTYQWKATDVLHWIFNMNKF